MHDFFARNRSQPQPQALHYSYEKAGLIVDNQPIPWCAEAVLVEALLRMQPQANRTREDFTLRLAGQDHVAESIAVDQNGAPCRAFFRLTVPAHHVQAELLWRGKSLGQLSLPVLSCDDFLQHFTLQHASLHVHLGEETLPGLTYVTTQCQNLFASALIGSATSLVPVPDLDVRVQVFADEDQVASVPVRLSSSQLRARQALATVALPRLRRRGLWRVVWTVQDRLLGTHQLKTITQPVFVKSLRLSATRFIVQDQADGPMRLTQTVPDLKGLARLGPCFWVSSSEPAMAGFCELEIRARLSPGDKTVPLGKQRVLISDGPEQVAAGTLAVEDLHNIKHFELVRQKQVLGILPLSGAPTATFNSEGGFSPAENFPWSATADAELQEKLGHLLKGK